MFSKLKQFRNMRSQAKQLQNQLSQEIISIEEAGIKIVMNGNQEIKELFIDEKYFNLAQKARLEKEITNAFASATKKVQRKMAEKMMKEKGLSGLSEMFK